VILKCSNNWLNSLDCDYHFWGCGTRLLLFKLETVDLLLNILLFLFLRKNLITSVFSLCAYGSVLFCATKSNHLLSLVLFMSINFRMSLYWIRAVGLIDILWVHEFLKSQFSVKSAGLFIRWMWICFENWN